nr:hypothetical protein [Tanacetum cinerariifolium]
MPFISKAETERLLSLPTPPLSPLISLSPPSAEERLTRCLAAPAHPSPPLPPLPSSLYLPPHVPTSLPLPSPPLPASLFIPPPVDRKEEILDVELPPRKKLCLTAPTSRYMVGESSTSARPTGGHRADYRFIGTLDAETKCRRDKEEALVSKEAWAQSVGLSTAVHQELQAYRTHTQIQDHRIASQEALTATLVAQISFL